MTKEWCKTISLEGNYAHILLEKTLYTFREQSWVSVLSWSANGSTSYPLVSLCVTWALRTQKCLKSFPMKSDWGMHNVPTCIKKDENIQLTHGLYFWYCILGLMLEHGIQEFRSSILLSFTMLAIPPDHRKMIGGNCDWATYGKMEPPFITTLH